MKPQELNQVVKKLVHKKVDKNSYVIKYGDIGDEFLIVTKGEVSVWLPVDPTEMLKPLKKFKEKVKSAILTKKWVETIEFKFHLDPSELAGDASADYCTIDQFKILCSAETPPSMVSFLWHQFQLHRAVSTAHLIEKHLASQIPRARIQPDDYWEQMLIEEIV